MTSRVLIAGVFGLSAAFVGVDAEAPFATNEAEACGVKVAVKAAPPKRNLRQVASRTRSFRRSGSRVAVRKRIDTESERSPIAAGQGETEAARKPVKREPIKRSKPKLRVAKKPEPKPAPKAEATPAPKPDKEKMLAKAEPAPVNKTVPSSEPAADSQASVSAELFFDLGGAKLSTDAEAELQPIVDWLKDNPNGTVVIEGHTDPQGGTARNRQLSIQRAKVVQGFLSSAAGVSRSRLKVEGHGETKLRYPRNSPKNRRVVIKTQPSGPSS